MPAKAQSSVYNNALFYVAKRTQNLIKQNRRVWNLPQIC